MDSRRRFLRNALFGVAGSGVLPLLGGQAQAAEPRATVKSLPEGLFSPVLAGDDVGLGWKLVKIYPPSQGAITLNLVTPGTQPGTWRAARVDVVLRDGMPKGPAFTQDLDFLVMDGGAGESAGGSQELEESLGRVLRRMAALAEENLNLAAREASVGLTVALQSQGERLTANPKAMQAAPGQLKPTGLL